MVLASERGLLLDNDGGVSVVPEVDTLSGSGSWVLEHSLLLLLLLNGGAVRRSGLIAIGVEESEICAAEGQFRLARDDVTLGVSSSLQNHGVLGRLDDLVDDLVKLRRPLHSGPITLPLELRIIVVISGI